MHNVNSALRNWRWLPVVAEDIEPERPRLLISTAAA
jgi:hypothetical protein